MCRSDEMGIVGEVEMEGTPPREETSSKLKGTREGMERVDAEEDKLEESGWLWCGWFEKEV